ncbi:MAG: DNA repair ATPase [Pirellulales bacterium]
MTESLATGTYEVLRNRLREASADLRERLERLNTARCAVFGNIETRLLSTLHVTTDHNCVPRDLMTVADRVLVGYNVQFGLKTEIVPEDVFGLYKIDGENAVLRPTDNLFDDRFRRDFAELIRYYKHTALQRFFHRGPHVYFVFQVGKNPTDIKAFKWTIDGDQLIYVDNRSEHEVRFPAQQAFRWTRATRESHRTGKHPHISIEEIVFVECVGGDLTIKVEDNTDDGSGIYSEPVENSDQTLDDAEIYYCVLGNLVLLKMRPYQEKTFRHLVFSIKRRQVKRLDGIERACVSLPDDHGVIFPDGVVLQSGESKVFDHGLQGACYERTVAAPSGEDYLYLFSEPASGTYLQLRYNLIRREVDIPFLCHGQAFFEDGRMLSFRAEDHAQKHHVLQMWQTPFLGPNAKPKVSVDSMLYKIGNRDLVRGMAECREVLQLTERDESYAGLYVDLVKQTTDLLDGIYWISRPEAENLAESLSKIRQAAAAAVEEFDKVVRVRQETEAALSTALQQTDETLRAVDRSRFEQIGDFTGRGRTENAARSCLWDCEARHNRFAGCHGTRAFDGGGGSARS